MYDFLVDHALKNVWCTPRQDLQAILKLARISSPLGVTGSSPLAWGQVAMPTPNDKYHVYQIGQVFPALLGLFPEQRVWHRLSTVMHLQNLVADVYTIGGLHLPRFETWVLVGTDRSIIVAVRDQPTIAPLKTEPVYLRLYSNAYFSSIRHEATNDQIYCRGLRMDSVNNGLLFQNQYHLWQAKPGHTQLFVNGVLKQDFIPQQQAIGDTLEFVYDSTVKNVIDFPIAGLPTFDSIKDAKRKYLLHYAGSEVGGDSIDYRDDLDVYLIKKGTASNGAPTLTGLYYHKNQNDALRQVTHRDYAVTVPYVNAYLPGAPGWTDVQQLHLRLIIRKAGYLRPLVNEAHRIRELYKLGEYDLAMALTGVESSVPVWQAPSLENSSYIGLMDGSFGQITRDLVEQAYGYNAISKLVGDSPLPVQVVNGRRQISVPYGLQAYSTMYEYDADGYLLGYYQHTLGAEYTPINAAATLIEGVVGIGSFKLGTVFGQNNVPIDPTNNYRYYIAPINHGVLDNTAWQDVTGDATKYQLVNGVVVWMVDQSVWATAVKSDLTFLAYDLTLDPSDNVLQFSIDAEATYPAGSAQGVMYIPFDRLDLWLNGKSLIENVDFYVAWPKVVIVNKKYLVDGLTQQITIRGTGFCNADMTRTPQVDAGFVKYGMLSRNNRYDVRDDKVTRIVVDGAVYEASDLVFGEDGVSIGVSDVANGVPYLIEYPVVPLRGVTNTDTYTLRAAALVIDKSISDYLTLKLPEPVETLPDQIQDKYPVYSPFCSKIMYDMINGVLDIAPFRTAYYSDKQVLDYLKDYTYLLDYDPCRRGVDLDHIAIHPHNLNVETQLDGYQYNFLNRTIKVYLDNQVDITRFVSIKPDWL
jgi:hypothetical protein